MYSEPQVVTVATVAKTLNRVAVGDRTATYENPDDGYSLRIYHTGNAKRKRHTVRLDHNKIAADPMLDGVSVQRSCSVMLAVDAPVIGFSSQELIDDLSGFLDWLQVGTNANKFIAGES